MAARWCRGGGIVFAHRHQVSHPDHDRHTRPDGCPLCGSGRVILTHSTESVHLWRCQRCGLQWPTLDTELVKDNRPIKPNQKP
jgi:ribosomal protein L37AE/L43A